MRRAIFSVCFLLAITAPCLAQGDKAKPNTLTPKEIADGWILLFDGATTFGWKINGEARVVPAEFQTGKELRLGGKEAASAQCSTAFGVVDIYLRYHTRNVAKMRVGDKTIELKAGTGIVSAEGADKNGLIIEVPSGQPGEGLGIDEIKIRPRNTTSIFNAKDLAGWKEFPGKKSKFAVNDKGELNVKDGPGDLQTVGKYQNFILQFECVSNGKHLNSGIFFRCRDNEYQNGYEAQIRNQFTAEASQKYLIEEYDPKTNKLSSKKEILSTAFDFGTGAIYRRVPARKGMSKDGEWFGMTIVAHGNHFATWVNGVQVTDWTDNRPKSDNARTGCKLEAGHISIQGHDPTTDLSFRNFRIAELK